MNQPAKKESWTGYGVTLVCFITYLLCLGLIKALTRLAPNSARPEGPINNNQQGEI